MPAAITSKHTNLAANLNPMGFLKAVELAANALWNLVLGRESTITPELAAKIRCS